MTSPTETTPPAPAVAANRPDLALYLLMHRSLRRSAASLAAATADLAGDGPSDRRRWKALARWYHGYADEVRLHHHIEDTLLFPGLAARVATYGEYEPTLAADHAELDVVLDRLTAALERQDAATAATLAAGLRDHLDEHLGFEDDELVPLFVRHFSPDEFTALNTDATKMTPFRQMLFTCPWLLSLLDGAEQDALLAESPKALVVIWKLTRGRYRRLAARALGGR